MTRLTNNQVADYDAYYSPDGTSIAWLQLISPTAWNGVGAWSRDGTTIYFHRLDGSSNGKWGLFSVASDGSGLQRIDPILPVNLEFPTN
ncbi:MAG: hypothetical protein AB8C46_08755 [Burkholderiaceae bacterium]